MERLIEMLPDCKAIIFDLDGTLLDTLKDIADAVNRVLSAKGYPIHSHAAYQWLVGNGAKRLIERALPPGRHPADALATCLQDFITDYNHHWAVSTRPYPGITGLIDALITKGIKLAVVTNKPHPFARTMVNHYFETAGFHPILGQQDGIPPKPHPQQALAAAGAMGVHPATCIFLGDSAVDMETAVRAGMYPVGAAWGFRTVHELKASGAAKVLHRPEDLLEII